MFKLFLSAFVAAVLVTSTLAQQLKTCPLVYQTTNPNGSPDVVGAPGTPCQQISGVPSGNCGTNVLGPVLTPDATCQFSLYWFAYRCCYQQTQQTFTTPGPGSTFATVGPGSTVSPQNLKPICPNGALPSIVAYSNPYTVACNVSNLLNQGCPTGFQCTMASNVLNPYGQAVSTSAYNLGAALTPYLCCQTLSMQSYTNVFIDSGLSPSPVPGAPTNAIASFVFATTPPAPVPYAMLTDDLSYLTGQLANPPTALNFFTSVSTAVYYQILIFDSTTNKDCFFYANVNASATATSTTQSTTLLLPTVPPTAANVPPEYFVQVYNAGTSTTPIWMQSTPTSTWMPPNKNTGSHRYVVLVWTTTTALTFAPAVLPPATPTPTPTMLNLNNAAYGDFAPSKNAQGTVSGGSFTTVSALLAGKFSTLLGTPKYGTYFNLNW